MILSLLVALFAVATPLIAAIEASLRESKPEFIVAYEDSSELGIYLSVHNVGTRAGVISDGFVTIDGETALYLKASSGPQLIAPESSALITYIALSDEKMKREIPVDSMCLIHILKSDNKFQEPADYQENSSAKIECLYLKHLLEVRQVSPS